MNYKCSIPSNIKNNETIVLPVSMNQPLERGERLVSIVEAFRNHGYESQVTILVCDYLNRHNCQDDAEALKQGDMFIEDHKDILEGFKVLRWENFLKSIDNNSYHLSYELVKKNSQEGSRFYNKIKKTWGKCLSANQSLDNSIKYQTEEYAAILCMRDIDHLFYPKRISNGMAYLYNSIEGYKPKYHHIKISDCGNKSADGFEKNESFFIGDQISRSSSNNHIHIAFRGLLEQMDMLLSSSELSEKSKMVFAEESEKMFMKHGLLSVDSDFD